MPSSTDIKTRCESIVERASRNNHRYAIFLEGKLAARESIVENFQSFYNECSSAYFGHNNTSVFNLDNAKPSHLVGKEFDFIVFESTKLDNVNLFAAAAGTIRGGGLLIISTDSKETKSNLNTFQNRFNKIALSDDQTVFIQADQDEIKDITVTNKQLELENTKPDQSDSIAAIKHVISGHRKRPLILLADRGRGKSASIGIALVELITEQSRNIVITAPTLASTSIIFKHLKLELPKATHCAGEVRFKNSIVKYITPESILSNLPKTDLLIVDEAAGIPSHILLKFQEQYSRIVFATTLHGYEGSGRSFSLRFMNQLKKGNTQFKLLELETPIRWAANDPLEKMLNQLFLFKTPEYALPSEIDKNNIQFDVISGDSLASDESKLTKIFQLLSSAHYRTKPSDLLQILTEPQLKIVSLKQDSVILGTALIIFESLKDIDLSREIFLGNRRIKGNLIPQTLINHLSIIEASQLKTARIVRIAIHPKLQNNGLGTRLLKECEIAFKKDIDIIGASFGATKDLLKFWYKNDFRCIRIGIKLESSSACHSVMYIKPTSKNGNNVTQLANKHFEKNFLQLLTYELSNFDPALASSILFRFDQIQINLPEERELKSIIAFAFGNKQFEDNLHSLKQYLCYELCGNHSTLSTTDWNIVISKVLQQKNWSDLVSQYNLQGKKQAIETLRSIYKKLLIANKNERIVTLVNNG